VDEDLASLRVRCFIVSSPRGQARRIVAGKALSQELTAEHCSANRLLAAKRRHPLLVGGARSGKAFVSFVASWRAA
jgi:hypothetical protein